MMWSVYCCDTSLGPSVLGSLSGGHFLRKKKDSQPLFFSFLQLQLQLLDTKQPSAFGDASHLLIGSQFVSLKCGTQSSSNESRKWDEMYLVRGASVVSPAVSWARNRNRPLFRGWREAIHGTTSQNELKNPTTEKQNWLIEDFWDRDQGSFSKKEPCQRLRS